jgi:hypothetical protein
MPDCADSENYDQQGTYSFGVMDMERIETKESADFLARAEITARGLRTSALRRAKPPLNCTVRP